MASTWILIIFQKGVHISNNLTFTLNGYHSGQGTQISVFLTLT